MLQTSKRTLVFLLTLVATISLVPTGSAAQDSIGITDPKEVCLDEVCIGQSIDSSRFDSVAWIVPQKDFAKISCNGVGCTPQVAFRGYSAQDQKALSDAVSWVYSPGGANYNLVTRENLPVLRRYRYECNSSPRRFTPGERRFFGAFKSVPSQYLTIIGFRLINGELKVYRIAREYPFHTPEELRSLARTVVKQYADQVLLYDGISSNAPPDVIARKKIGWFGRSSMFNPGDLSDNRAELVLIDPRTRPLLEPSSMPESGEIRPLPVALAPQCSQSIPIR